MLFTVLLLLICVKEKCFHVSLMKRWNDVFILN